MILEFIGTPGAGKTTLLCLVRHWLRQRGIEAYSPREAARVYARRTLAGRVIGRLLPARWREPLLWQVYYRWSILYACAFLARHPVLSWRIAKSQQRRPRAALVQERRVLYWLFRHAGSYEFLRALRRPHEALLFDEGFVHRVVQLNASEVEEPQAGRIAAYVDLLPRPDLVIHVSAPADICQRRIHERGVWERYRQKDPVHLSRFLESASRAVELTVPQLRDTRWPLVEVENGGDDLAAVEDDLDRKLTGVLRCANRSAEPVAEGAAPRVMMVVRLFYPWIGGAERQAHKLARTLMARNVGVQVVTGWWFRGTPRREALEGIPVYRNSTLWEFFGIKGLRKLGGYLYILTLLWFLWRRRSDYDIIHVHGLNYHTFAAALAGRLLDKPVITKLANSGPASDIEKMRHDQQLTFERFMLPAALRCTRFIAINRKIVEELMAAGVPRKRIVELPNGVETDSLPVRCRYELSDPARIIFLGRLQAQKGVDVLLRAIARLKYSGRFCLDIVGDGPLLHALHSEAERLAVAEKVVFWGSRDDVRDRILAADIFVLPSRAEGISNALLEAMACGSPVIASDIPGNIDVIEHNGNGLLFASGDPASLAVALLALMRDGDLRKRLGQAARRTVEEHFSLDHVAECYMSLYRELLAEAGAGG